VKTTFHGFLFSFFNVYCINFGKQEESENSVAFCKLYLMLKQEMKTRSFIFQIR